MRKNSNTTVDENVTTSVEETKLPETEVVETEAEPVEDNSQVPADEEPEVSEKPKTGKVANSRYVPLRENPSGSSNVITVMKVGDAAEILDRVTGYYKIKTNKDHRVGFVSSTYFRED